MEQLTLALLIKLVRLLVGIFSFIGLFSLDVWKAWKSKAYWVPQGALVLSAFSLQLLDLLDTDNVDFADRPDIKRWDLERMLRNVLWIDGGRVMICVYMGYLLPEMGRSASKSVVWSDIGALALSLSTHIFSELYAFIELYSKLGEGMTLPLEEDSAPSPSQGDSIRVNPLSLVLRVCIVVCATMLFLLLGSAAFAGKTLHKLSSQKIPLALKEEPADYEPESVKQDVLRSWAVAWVCKPDYVIARSVLPSSVGVVVTASVWCFAAEWITQDYKELHSNDGIDWLRDTATAFMTLLILIGWSIIFLRWMFAIFYFPGKYEIGDQGCFHVEDFWIRHIFEITDDVKYPRESWDQQVSGGGFLENIKLQFFNAIKAHVILGGPLLRLQQGIVLFSRLCCFLSEKFFFVHKICLGVVGNVDHDFDGVVKSRLLEALNQVMMPGETGELLLDGSYKAIKEAKGFMDKGHTEGIKSTKLIELLSIGSTDPNSEGKKFLEILRERLSSDLHFDYLTKLSWKMTALSLIQIIIELDGRQANSTLQAYSEAYVFLDLLDNSAGPDGKFLPELFVRGADKQFTDIQQELDRNSAPRPAETATMEDALKKVRSLEAKANEHMSINPNDSVDWWGTAANNSLHKVCTIILPENNPSPDTANYTELMNIVRRLLADILAIALKEEVGKALVNNCWKWAEALEDEKIKAAVYVAGKLSGVKQATQKEASHGDLNTCNFSAFNISA